MKKYNTKPIDYTGCHPVIMEHLKRGEMIKCRVRDVIDSEWKENPRYVKLFNYKNDFPYQTKVGPFALAEPIEIITETRVKKASDIVKWFQENGWVAEANGSWSGNKAGEVCFHQQMFQYCGKVKPVGWVWRPAWLEEVEVTE